MAQLPVEITHSLRFLNDLVRTVSKIISYIKEVDLKIKSISMDDEKYGNKMRKISNDARDDIDTDMEQLKTDYQIFNTEITDIISKKNTTEVIYSLHSYESFVDKFDDMNDELDLVLKKLELEKDSNAIDKDFIRAITYNKLIVPVYRTNEMISHVKGRLQTLTGKK